jgi:hypothetical protein
MDLIKNLHRNLFSKDLDHRFAKSLKKVKEVDIVTASINKQLNEIEKQLNINTVKYR